VSRLFGGEVGTAFMQTFVRIREQIHSNLIGLHISEGSHLTTDRLLAYLGHLRPFAADTGHAATQANGLLAAAVTAQANVLAYRDGFLAAAVGALACLVLVGLMRRGRTSLY